MVSYERSFEVCIASAGQTILCGSMFCAADSIKSLLSSYPLFDLSQELRVPGLDVTG